jgi:hypothetical protein
MVVTIKKPPALKHGAYSAMNVLPGESADEFAKLHQELVAEWTPNGALEEEIVAAMARAVWRQKNLETLQVAKLAQKRVSQIYSAMVSGIGEDPTSGQANQVERTFIEECRAAEKCAQQELGELYVLVETGEGATVDHLIRELQVIERLDAVVDRCIKRLLMVRGLKSISGGQASASLQATPRVLS